MVVWYLVYCYLHAAFNLALFAVCVVFILKHAELANSIVNGGTILAVGLVSAPLSLFLAGTNLTLARAKVLKNPWAVHMSNIVVGIASCVLAPIALPLFFFWFKPEVRAFYDNQRPSDDPPDKGA